MECFDENFKSEIKYWFSHVTKQILSDDDDDNDDDGDDGGDDDDGDDDDDYTFLK